MHIWLRMDQQNVVIIHCKVCVMFYTMMIIKVNEQVTYWKRF